MYTINCHTGEALKHKDDEDALAFSFDHTSLLAVKEPRDLSIGLLTQNVMWLYKKITGDALPPDISRKAAAEALFLAIKKHSSVAPTIERDHTMPATKSRSTRRVARQATRNARSETRHNSPLAGKKLMKVSKQNPRRVGTEGYKSWEKYNSGVTYEKAVEAGARPVDIRWDIEHGFLKVSK
jgi:hypothetical protein